MRDMKISLRKADYGKSRLQSTYHQTMNAGNPRELVSMVSLRQSLIRCANSGIIHKAVMKENQNITPIVPRCFTPENSLKMMNNETEQPVKIQILCTFLN